MPPRSPIPSPSESAKLRGYIWYTTADFHHWLGIARSLRNQGGRTGVWSGS